MLSASVILQSASVAGFLIFLIWLFVKFERSGKLSVWRKVEEDREKKEAEIRRMAADQAVKLRSQKDKLEPLDWWKSRFVILFTTFFLSACGTVKSNYPTFPHPIKPAVDFTEPAPGVSGIHCLDDTGLKIITDYVWELESLVYSYECEIAIINGDTCLSSVIFP